MFIPLEIMLLALLSAVGQESLSPAGTGSAGVRQAGLPTGICASPSSEFHWLDFFLVGLPDSSGTVRLVTTVVCI